MNFLVLIFFLVFINAAQTQSNWIQTQENILLDTAACKVINFDFEPSEITIKHWDKDHVAIAIQIQSSSSSEILSLLQQAGRYQIRGGKDGEDYLIQMPNMERDIWVDEALIRESVLVFVSAPYYYRINDNSIHKLIDSELIGFRSVNAEQGAIMLHKMEKIQEFMNLDLSIHSTNKNKIITESDKLQIIIDGKKVSMDNLSLN